MPKWGNINERRGQLHEVIRLSGMNLIIDDTDHPLIIKVATIVQTRIQVYFIDNDDYFSRRQMAQNEKGEDYADNGERAIFFARGVLETVKKLRWTPDIIHCQGWISHLVPVYLKKVFKDDHIFSSSRVVLSLYNDAPGVEFAANFASKAVSGSIKPGDLPISEHPDGIKLAETAAKYSDGIILGSPDLDPKLLKYCKSLKVPVLPYKAESFEDGSYIDDYNALYDKL
jgi:starch synthase